MSRRMARRAVPVGLFAGNQATLADRQGLPREVWNRGGVTSALFSILEQHWPVVHSAEPGTIAISRRLPVVGQRRARPTPWTRSTNQEKTDVLDPSFRLDTVQLFLLAIEAEEAAAAFVRDCQDEPTATVETWRAELEALNQEMTANGDATYLCSITRHDVIRS